MSKTALTASAIKDYLAVEQRWLSLAGSYELTEQLSRVTEQWPFSRPSRCQRGQSKRVVKFAICEQSRIGGDSGAAKLQCEAAVKSSRRTPGSDSTTRVRHHCLPQSRISC